MSLRATASWGSFGIPVSANGCWDVSVKADTTDMLLHSQRTYADSSHCFWLLFITCLRIHGPIPVGHLEGFWWVHGLGLPHG